MTCSYCRPINKE